MKYLAVLYGMQKYFGGPMKMSANQKNLQNHYTYVGILYFFFPLESTDLFKVSNKNIELLSTFPKSKFHIK